MNNPRLPTQDSATGRGLKTFVQAVIGFIIGLTIALFNVPGVPDAVVSYVQKHAVEMLLGFGLPVSISTGGASFVWNLLRKNIRNY